LEPLEWGASSHHIVARDAFRDPQHSQGISAIAEVGWWIGPLVVIGSTGPGDLTTRVPRMRKRRLYRFLRGQERIGAGSIGYEITYRKLTRQALEKPLGKCFRKA
jgi:hypothetical protein